MIKNKNFNLDASKSSIDLLWDDDDISIVSLDLLHQDDGPLDCNRNRCHIGHEAIEKSLDTFKNKPIIFRLSFDERSVTEHARNELESKKMRVGGIIPNDATFRFVERDNGKTYLNTEAILYKRYCPQLIDILKKNDGELEISIEIRAEGTEDKDNGIFFIDSMVLQGICILDPSVTQGIEGSNIKVLKFSQTEIDSMNKKYMVFSKKTENRQNIFTEIKTKMKQEEIVNSLSITDLEKKLWQNIQKYQYTTESGFKYSKYYIEEIYPDDKEIIILDQEKAEYYKVSYLIDNSEISIDIDKKVLVEKGWHERPNNDKRFSIVFAKDEYGTGEAVMVDKSSEAVSNKQWGDVDKTALRHKVLNAKNYKTLVHDVYAEVEDGWEDAPSSKLKYPIMLIEGNKAVYARYGLSSALGYAKAEGNTAVVDKVEKLYKQLKIEGKEETVDKTKEVENKLDAENPELEKIRDDADAMEDNKKEEVEQTNAEDVEKVNSEEVEQTNAEEVDKPAEEKLKDDIDADEDYWEKKYAELEEKYKCMESEFATCKEELNTFKIKADKDAMLEYLNTYRKSFATKEEYDVMASKIENSTRVDFEKEVDEKTKEFVRKMSEDCGCDDAEEAAKKDIEYKNSFMVNAELQTTQKNRKKTIDDVLDSL